MIIDAHQHFWRLARGDYRFPSPQDTVLYRDFQPDDLKPLLDHSGVSRTILVQATDTVAETGDLLKLAAETSFVAGIVGWWDPREEDCLSRLLALPHSDRLVGVRPMLQKYDDVAWLVEQASLSDLTAVADRNLAFDALVDSRHLERIVELCRAMPNLRIVIDHMGKPWRHPSLFGRWQAVMRALAAYPNCFVKISGFPFAQGIPGPHGDLPALFAQLRQWYGADRLVWGSDWPVAEREGGFAKAIASIRELVAPEERDRVFGENAAALYRLERQAPT